MALTAALFFVHVESEHHRAVGVRVVQSLLPWRSQSGGLHCRSQLPTEQAHTSPSSALSGGGAHSILSDATKGSNLGVKLLCALFLLCLPASRQSWEPLVLCLLSLWNLQFVLLS